MGKRGRPKKLNLVTLDQAIQELKNALLRRHNNNEEIARRKLYSKNTLYNMRRTKFLTSYGDKTCALLDLDEVLMKLVR